MRKLFYLCAIIVAIPLLKSCKTTNLQQKIEIPQEMGKNNHSHPSLTRFIQDPENAGASVVVRDPGSKGGAFNPFTNRVCALIEQALMKNFNPRDRILFENAVAKLADGSDYPAIRKATGTDLIFEVTFNEEEYLIKDYYSNGMKKSFEVKVKKNKKRSIINPLYLQTRTINPVYSMDGFSIEIKVILLADNLIAGVFKYYYTPCSADEGGCHLIYFDESTLRYINPKTAIENNAREESSRVERRNERFDREVGDFISNVVIPSMFAEMAGQKPVQNNKNAAGTQPNKDSDANPSDIDIQKATKEILESLNAPKVQKSSYELTKSVSELILSSMEEQQEKLKPEKRKEYKTDQERLTNLTPAKQQEIADFILSITTSVSTPAVEKDEIALFCKSNYVKKDQAVIAFLNEECVGVGSLSKGLFTNLPKDKYGKGIYSLQLYSLNDAKKALFDTRVNFSLKNYYQFEWDKNKLKLVN